MSNRNPDFKIGFSIYCSIFENLKNDSNLGNRWANVDFSDFTSMPRCYLFNFVETPMFVTTRYLSETFCKNPSVAILRKMTMTKPEKNDNGLRQKPFLTAAISSICARIQVHKLTSGARPFHLLTKSEKSKFQKSGF